MVWEFLIFPQFIGVWGGIAVELGGTHCLLNEDNEELKNPRILKITG